MKHDEILDKIKQTVEPALKNNDEELNLVVYTDGGCANNGDKLGGWGVHGYYYTSKETKSNSGCKKGVPTDGGYVTGRVGDGSNKADVVAYFDYFGCVKQTPTTNNLAEMVALYRGLELVELYPVSKVLIYTDSDYTRKGLLDWIDGWRSRDWKSSNGKDVANKDMWIELESKYKHVLELIGKDNLEIVHIDGHSGDIGNDKADELATAGAWGQRNLDENPEPDFNIKDVNNYWTTDGISKMFTESRLFFDEGSHETDGNWYYQGSLPYAGSETEKEKNLGKRVTDLTLSVLFLNSPEEVIDSLQKYVIKNKRYQGIFKLRLDLINHDNNYKHLSEYQDGRYLIFDDETASVSSPSKSKLVNGINTARLAYRLFIEFDLIRSVLQSAFSESNPYGIKAMDITDYMYHQKPKSKKSNQLITKVNPNLGDCISIGHSVVGDIPSQVTLTLGIDCPSKVNLGRLKDLNPRVQLLFYPQSKNKYSYFVAIETVDGIGVWCAPYSNTVLLPDNEVTS